MATLLVFENSMESACMCADVCHDWENQKRIFGNETERVLKVATKLFYTKLYSFGDNTDVRRLKKTLYGIAKRHHVHVIWYGEGSVCEPDRFLIMKNGQEVALIQC